MRASDPLPAILQLDLGPDARTAGIRAAFTTRAAGNLGLHVGDDAGAVHARRASLRHWAGQEVAFARHNHGTTILEGQRPGGSTPSGDGWCASGPTAFAVIAADCLPILLHDASARVIAAVHAGRAGLLAGVVRESIAQMRRRGAERISAIIGPAICGECYEVSPELAGAVRARGLPVTTSRWGTPALDLPGIATRELIDLGASVARYGTCTLEDPRFFSHRSSDRMDGRHGALIVMR